MLQVVSQTDLDTVLFIGNDEPVHKIVGLNLGLLKKGFHCDGTGAITATFMTNAVGNAIEGLRTRFTKTTQHQSNLYSSRHSRRYFSNKSFFKRKTVEDNTTTELTVSRGIKSNSKVEVSLRISPSVEDRKKLLEIDIISKYSRHIKTTDEMAIFPNIYSSLDLNENDFSPKTDEQEEASKVHLDVAVSRVKDFETNFKYLYPFLVMRNFTGTSNTTLQQISLAEFDKFARQIDIIEEVTIPSKFARKQFIEICDIFKNNNVLTKLKANNFEFRKNGNNLCVDFFGIQLVNEKEFKHFQYLDHPGINFCADFLEKSRTFNIVEAKISKEIITRI